MENNEVQLHLKSLWKPRVSKKTGKLTFKRSDELIVPRPRWDDVKGGGLNTESWAYCVPYCFREALDLSFDTRRRTDLVFDEKTGEPVMDEKTGKQKRKSVSYQLWTQGHRIHFKEGDTLISSKSFPALQVKNSEAMKWDEESNSMFEGMVNYEYFDQVKFGHVGNVKTVSQMGFLNILVGGLHIVSTTRDR